MFAYYLDLALRSFRRNKALTALMVLAIALGIGASMTTLTVFHVLSGDPMKAVPYTVRFKFPANYVIPAHSHPADENVAITSGEFFMGMGDKVDKTHATSLPVGGYALMPAGMNHFAFTKGEVTLLLYGTGPVDFKYVNPADDPRNHK